MLGPGDLVCMDSSRPYRVSVARAFEMLVFAVPKVLLRPHVDVVGARTATAIPARAGLAALVAPFLRSVGDGLLDGTVSEDDADLGEGVVDLVRGLFAGAAAGVGPTCSPTCKATIELRLHDPASAPRRSPRRTSSPPATCTGCSSREGVSVSEWIRMRRLEHCRRDLEDPALAGETVLAIASRWGLRNPGHFSRLFHARVRDARPALCAGVQALVAEVADAGPAPPYGRRMTLEGKAAVITGGGGGIGCATGVAMGRAGARVMLVDRDAARLEEAAKAVAETGAEVRVRTADVAASADVRGYVADAVEAFGTIDVLFNNAGIIGPVGALAEYDEDAFDRIMAINVRGVFLGLRHVLPIMIAQRLRCRDQHGIAVERARAARARPPTTRPSTRCSASRARRHRRSRPPGCGSTRSSPA